jgi:nucleoside-diphosphate-sugar epimerase
MKAFVTGAAGFIGSHLAIRLLADGHEVVGVDCFTDAYDPAIKLRNVASIRSNPRFTLVTGDLRDPAILERLADCNVVFHLAGQAGVRGGWGEDFAAYVERNVLATQRLLEVARGASLSAFVLASSSSVYGEAPRLPVRETDSCHPLSPYAISKLAAEQLGLAYWRQHNVPLVALRYFAVFGPGQRPDMAFSRFIAALRAGDPLPIYGDGLQRRDFTYVDDAVEATMAAATRRVAGEVINVGSGTSTSVRDVVGQLELLLECRAEFEWLPESPGEARQTLADISRARELLAYAPHVDLAHGLAAQVEWAQSSTLNEPNSSTCFIQRSRVQP